MIAQTKTNTVSKLNVWIVEDEIDIGEPLASYLYAQPNIGNIELFENAELALKAIHEGKAWPDVILLDIILKTGNLNGIEAIPEFLYAYRQSGDQGKMKIIMLTCSNSEEDMLNALKAGAIDFVEKTSRNQKILETIIFVASGNIPIQTQLFVKVCNIPAVKNVAKRPLTPNKKPNITTSERRVKNIMENNPWETDKFYAEKLFLSIDTIRSHIKALRNKLDCTKNDIFAGRTKHL